MTVFLFKRIVEYILAFAYSSSSKLRFFFTTTTITYIYAYSSSTSQGRSRELDGQYTCTSNKICVFSTCSLAIRGKSKKKTSVHYLLPSSFPFQHCCQTASCQIPYPVIHTLKFYLYCMRSVPLPLLLVRSRLCISFIFVNSFYLPNEL